MADQPTKTPKDKKKPKVERKKLKVEGDITQPDEFITDDSKVEITIPPVDITSEVVQTSELLLEAPEPLISATEVVEKSDTTENKANEENGTPINPENLKDEMKKFKQQLLQSVAQNGSGTISQTPHDEIDDDTEEMLARIRERSASRPYVIPATAPPTSNNVLVELDEKKLTELKEAFLLFDMDGDGCISHSDLKATIISLGQKTDDNAIRNMLSEASDPLDFDAFVTLLGYRTIELDPEETLVDALAQWDRAGTGLISEERIRHDLMTWGDRFTPREVDWALEEAPTVDKRGNTMIDYIRFCKMLCGLRKAHKKFNE